MNYNEINIKFIDSLCVYTNKVSPNDFNNKYLTQCIKRIIAFKDNYEKSTHKEFYVLYDVNGTFQPYCVDYKENNKLIQRHTFVDLKSTIECYNNIEL